MFFPVLFLYVPAIACSVAAVDFCVSKTASIICLHGVDSFWYVLVFNFLCFQPFARALKKSPIK